ncbi:MAG: hypothetical protein Q3980_09620 [Turicibacter sp.]|nr:hypothetical protein [Turicibacter sp.]
MARKIGKPKRQDCAFGIHAFYSDRDIRHEKYNYMYSATKENKTLS